MYKRNKYIMILADIANDSKIKHVIGLHAFIPNANCYFKFLILSDESTTDESICVNSDRNKFNSNVTT